jgi:hypothetical protein
MASQLTAQEQWKAIELGLKMLKVYRVWKVWKIARVEAVPRHPGPSHSFQEPCSQKYEGARSARVANIKLLLGNTIQ